MYTDLQYHVVQFHDAWRRTETSNFGFSNKGRVRPK